MLLLIFQCMQGCAPIYLRELLVKRDNTRSLRSKTKTLLQILYINPKSVGDSAFWAYAPHLCNELPDNITAADSLQKFQDRAENISILKGGN